VSVSKRERERRDRDEKRVGSGFGVRGSGYGVRSTGFRIGRVTSSRATLDVRVQDW
jgi:hypothetical protein